MPNDPISKIKLPNNTTYDIHDSRIDSVSYLENAESASYSDLKTKVINGTLVPGTWYRIMDYVATTTDTESRSANHPFDIIVMASANNKLSEEGYAALHSGDTYFANNNLAAWKVWYCIDNDTTRFAWADSTNGKGVVYRLIDEFQNDLPFDFKGIQFKRYKIDDIDIKVNKSPLRALVVDSRVYFYIGGYFGLSVTANKFSSDSSDYKWFYAFTFLGSTWSASISDASIGSECLSTHNTIRPTTNGKLQSLTNVVFARGEVLENTVIGTYEAGACAHNCFFAEGSTQLSVFGHAANNRSGGQFRRNIILGHFRHNTIASDVENNEFCAPEDFSFNDFGDLFQNNSIVGSTSDGGAGTVLSNRFESQFRDNVILASDFSYNVFNSIFRRNKADSNNFQGNEFGVVYDSNLNGDIRFNVSNGYMRYIDLTTISHCQFLGNLQYINCEVNSSTSGASFTGVMLKGPINGTSSVQVHLWNSRFSLASSGVTGRAIVVESNSDGEIIATWKDADGNNVGVYATPSETDSDTWHNISSGGGGGSGTVTSVAMTVPTGLSVSGSPITSSGTLAVSLASGYEIPQSSAVVHTTGYETIAGTKYITGALDIASDNDACIVGDTAGFAWIADDNGDSVQDALNAKQATLVSGTNIKTINNQSLLGSGNITIQGGGSSSDVSVYTFQSDSSSEVILGQIDVSYDTYQSFLDDWNNGRTIVIKTQYYYNNTPGETYEWGQISFNDGVFDFGRLQIEGDPRFHEIWIYPPSSTGDNAGVSTTYKDLVDSVWMEEAVRKVYTLTYSSWSEVESGLTVSTTMYSQMANDARNAKNVILRLQNYTTSGGQVTYGEYSDFYLYGYWQNGSSTSGTLAFMQVVTGSGVFLRNINITRSGNSISFTFSETEPQYKYNISQSISGSGTTYNYPTTKAVVDYVSPKVLPTVTSSDNDKILKVVNGAWAAATGGGGSTADCVHITGDESIAGDKTFTDDIIVGDASNIKYGASSGSGFTRDIVSTVSLDYSYITFSVEDEPKAFIMTFGDVQAATASTGYVIAVVGDSTGTHAVYTTGTQNNYSSGFTASYSNGNFTITAPTGVSFAGGGMTYHLVYYYGSGNLTFRTAQVSPGSGATSVTFTGTGLTAVPEMYATILESQVNNESYRRVSLYTNSSASIGSITALGVSFYSSNIYNTTSNFTVSYNNGLVINSGGTNAGGYFHNPGTYTLYYLMSSDVGGGGGSYSDLADELSDIKSDISALETGKQDTLVSGTSIKTINSTSLLGSGNIAISSLPTVTTTNNGQLLEVSNGAWATGRKITISSSEPTSATGNNGDIWIVI